MKVVNQCATLKSHIIPLTASTHDKTNPKNIHNGSKLCVRSIIGTCGTNNLIPSLSVLYVFECFCFVPSVPPATLEFQLACIKVFFEILFILIAIYLDSSNNSLARTFHFTSLFFFLFYILFHYKLKNFQFVLTLHT